MRFLLFLFPLLARYSDTCAPTSTTTPIVCACSTSEVALLYRIDGGGTGEEAIQPVGAVSTADSNNCPTSYTVTCDPPADQPGATVMMMFQDSASGTVTASSLFLNCTDGNWLYLGGVNGDQLVVSVSCQWS